MRTLLLLLLIPSLLFAQSDLSAKLAKKDRYGGGLITPSQKRLDGWSLVATNPFTPSSGYQTNNTNWSQTYKTAHKATVGFSGLRLVYGNLTSIQNSYYYPNYNPITVAASVQKYGSSATDETSLMVPVHFNGAHYARLDPGNLLFSDQIPFQAAKNETFFVKSFRHSFLPPAPTSPPSLTVNTSGGTLVASSTYYVCYAYVFSDGTEGLTSAGVLATTPGGGNTVSITVSAPPVIPSAIGYKIYMTNRGNGQTGIYLQTLGVISPTSNALILNEVSASQNFFKRQGGVAYSVAGNGTAGGTQYDGLATGEGYVNDDQTQNGFVATQQAAIGNTYAPMALMGRTNVPQKTVAILGTSIAAGTGDQGFVYNSGGFITRALSNQISLKFDPTTNPLYASVRLPLGGSRIQDFGNLSISNQIFRGWLGVAELATNVISDYGTNDLSAGLSTMQTYTLALAKHFTDKGIKFFTCTIIPRTNSTDGWQTVTNQTTQGSTETTRLAYNAWLRDSTGTTGFIAQATAQTSASGLVGFMDPCKYLEVNSSNVLTQNGGFWRIPTAPASVTGTITATGTNQWTVSNTSMTANLYKGMTFLVTSGTQINKQGCILWNNTSQINTASSIGGTPANGDSYSITNLSTIDGIHPASQGHIWMAQAVQEKLGQLQY